MKSTRAKAIGLVLASLLALGFTSAFISSALAGGGCDPDGQPNETVTCKDTSDGDITTSTGNDTVSVDNSDVGNIDTGNGDDSVQSTGPSTSNDNLIDTNDTSGFSTIGNIDVGEGNNTVNVNNTIVGNDFTTGNDTLYATGIQAGDGNNSVDVSRSLISTVSLGDGNNTINYTNGALVGVTTLGDGNNQVSYSSGSVSEGLLMGNGDNKVSVDPTSGVIYILTGSGNDTIDTNNTSLGVAAGSGNDNVTVSSGSFLYVPFSSYDGGADYDKLTFKFTVGSQKEKDSFKSMYEGTAQSGVLLFGGHYYIWQNFEELSFLLKVAHASGNDDVEVSVLSDSRLNDHDLAAPIAVYCKSGQIEGWVIDPATGNGNQQFVAPLSAFPTSSNGVSGAINGDQATITYAGYNFSFPVIACP